LKIYADDEFPLFEDWTEELHTWKPKLKNAIASKSFASLYTLLKAEYKSKTVFPPVNLIFNAFRLCPVN